MTSNVSAQQAQRSPLTFRNLVRRTEPQSYRKSSVQTDSIPDGKLDNLKDYLYSDDTPSFMGKK